MEFEGADKLLKRTRGFVENHLDIYLSSEGREGHIMDLTHANARGMLPTLLLKTVGRRSGKSFIAPLIYGCYGGEWIVVASKGGAPDHPAWFLNLQEQKEAVFQIGPQSFRGAWRLAEGEERKNIWSYMAHLYPPYQDYQKATARVIPIVMLNIMSEIPSLNADQK